MINCPGTSASITLTTGSAHSVNVHVSWVDNIPGSAPVPGATNTAISTATTTTIMPSPAASSTVRNAKTIYLTNTDGSNTNLLTVLHSDGTTTVRFIQFTLQPGQTLAYDEGKGWNLLDAS